MPTERRGQAIRVMPTLVNRQREEPTGCDGGRQLSMNGTSRVSREAQARICERLGVRLPGATRPSTDVHGIAIDRKNTGFYLHFSVSQFVFIADVERGASRTTGLTWHGGCEGS